MTGRAAEALGRLARQDDGQGLAEYGLILLIVSVVAVAVLELIGVDVRDFITTAADAVDRAVG